MLRVRFSMVICCSGVNEAKRPCRRSNSEWRKLSIRSCSNDGGFRIQTMHAPLKALYFLLNQQLGALRLSSAIADVGFDYLLQVIDVIDKHAIKLTHRRIDISGYSNIDEEHRPVLAALHE